MFRILGAIVFILVAAALLFAVLPHTKETLTDTAPVLAPAPEPVTTGTVSGTLTYTRNNAGLLVPYLVFRAADGAVATKALTFATNSACSTPQGDYPCPLIADALSHYVGAGPVQVQGTVVEEHIIVSDLRML